jgi:general L-amino acid transport system permease protein
MASTAASAPSRPPQVTTSMWGWLRENLFNNILNSLISVAVLALIVWLLSGIIQWLFTSAGWQAVLANLRLFMVYTYPADAVWRVQLGVWIVALLMGLSWGIWGGIFRSLAVGLATLMAVSAILPILAPPSGAVYQIPPLLFIAASVGLIVAGYPMGNRFGRILRRPVTLLWLLAFPFIMYVLVYGIGATGPLRHVETNLWGGLLLTITLTVVGIVCSFPLGVLLALGRRSNLPVVKLFCTIYIEVVRGVPLVTVFFVAQLMVPLFLPQEMRVDNVVRAMIAVTLFSAAYLAENVRGGLQSIPRGQVEAAHALGLGYLQTTMLITLPQALRAVIPALVGQFISLFKDTSLVVIVGLRDLLGVAQVVQTQTQWLGTPGGVWREALFFVAMIYFIVSFAMSRVSLRIERSLGVGRR